MNDTEEAKKAWLEIKDILGETIWHCPTCKKSLGQHEEDCPSVILSDYFEDKEKENG